MSRFTRYAATTQTLTLAAMEEASRRGAREADLEDLLLALVLSEQTAGTVLRELGITIRAARAAVEQYQREQIASLGITLELPAAGNIVFHETGGYEWSKRASDLIRRAGDKAGTADAAAVLRELVSEPSGLIADLLPRLGTTSEEVLTALNRSTPAPAPSTAGKTRRRGQSGSAIESFIPAPVDDVRTLLTDPARVPDWEPMISCVEDVATGNGIWAAHVSTTRPDGKPLKVDTRFRRRTLQLMPSGERAHISWRFAYPDAPNSPPVTVTFDLAPTTGGTELRATMTCTARQGIRFLLRPLQRFLMWIRLSQITAAISRVYR